MNSRQCNRQIDENKLHEYICKVEKIQEIEWDQPYYTLTTRQGVEEPIMGPNYPDFLFETRDIFDDIRDFTDVVNEMWGKIAPEDMDLRQTQAFLTYIFQNERFCDGLIDEFIRSGEFLRALHRLEELVTGETTKIVFHAPTEWYGFLSNWYLSDFSENHICFSSVEQYIMYNKAMLFNDKKHADQILSTNDPCEIQKLGRLVNPFNSKLWDGLKQLILYRGLMAKFTQNEELRDKLVNTGSRVLVEGTRTDLEYANGLNRDDPNRYNEMCWKGKNLLGFTLMAVRSDLNDPCTMPEDELMRRLVYRLLRYPEGTEMTTAELLHKVFPNATEFPNMIDIDSKLFAGVPKNLILDRSAYINKDIGLPCNIPFIIKRIDINEKE